MQCLRSISITRNIASIHCLKTGANVTWRWTEASQPFPFSIEISMFNGRSDSRKALIWATSHIQSRMTRLNRPWVWANARKDRKLLDSETDLGKFPRHTDLSDAPLAHGTRYLFTLSGLTRLHNVVIRIPRMIVDCHLPSELTPEVDDGTFNRGWNIGVPDSNDAISRKPRKSEKWPKAEIWV